MPAARNPGSVTRKTCLPPSALTRAGRVRSIPNPKCMSVGTGKKLKLWPEWRVIAPQRHPGISRLLRVLNRQVPESLPGAARFRVCGSFLPPDARVRPEEALAKLQVPEE